MTILLATNNLHKKQELDELMKKLCPGLRLLLPADAGLAGWDHEETADSFLGNALGKARALHRDSQGQYPVLADDSGLCVDALGGKPGIFSARWGQAEAGRKLSDHEKNQLLLTQIPPQASRTARFVCALALVVAPHRVYTVEESWEGEIAREEAGEGGFGYDPLFYVPEEGLSASQLGSGRKNQLSHRGRAARILACLLSELKIVG